MKNDDKLDLILIILNVVLFIIAMYFMFTLKKYDYGKLVPFIVKLIPMFSITVNVISCVKDKSYYKFKESLTIAMAAIVIYFYIFK